MRDANGAHTRPRWFNNASLTVPISMMCRHTWEAKDMAFGDVLGAGDYAYAEFLQNSMFNIYSGYGGTGAVSNTPSTTYQPQWRDFMTGLYSRYCVIRSRIRVAFSKMPVSTSTDAAYGVYCCVYQNAQDSATSTRHPTSPDEIIDMESAGQGFRYIPLLPSGINSTATVYLDGPVYQYRQLGLSQRADDCQTVTTSNPLSPGQWFVSVVSMGDINEFNVRVNVHIEFECLWTNRVTTKADDA